MTRRPPKPGQKTMVKWELIDSGDPNTGTGKRLRRRVVKVVKLEGASQPPESFTPGVSKEGQPKYIDRGNYTADLTAEKYE